MTQAPKRLKDSSGSLATALADYADAPLPTLALRSVERRSSLLPIAFGVPLAVAAALALVVAFRPGTRPASILLAAADARVSDAAGPLARSTWKRCDFRELSSGTGLAIASEGDHRLTMLAASTVERAGADRLRLRNGTLGVSTRGSIVLEAGDSVVRLSKGAVEVSVDPLAVRALEGEVSLELPSQVVRLAANEAWPPNAPAARTAPFLASATSSLHVEAEATVSIDGVIVGTPPLDVPLSPGVHQASAQGVSVAVDTPTTREVVIPSPASLLAAARTTADLDEALRLFARLSSSPNAELALYERAQRQVHAGRLDGAWSDLDELSSRFPAGALRAEAALSRVEVLVALERGEALAEATAFLERFPESERRAEVLILRAELWRRANDRAKADADLVAASTDERWSDEAHWRRCFVSADPERAARDYLRLHPAGTHAAEARAALGGSR